MNSKLLVAFFCFCFFSLTASAAEHEPAAAQQAASAPLTTIKALDLPRYMGTWYEIARYPNWFQEKCVSNSTAEYHLRDDGKVQVINRCRLENGKMHMASGVARQVGPATSPKLKVIFAPSWLSFIPALWADYWVIDLDDDYQLVAVSEPTRKYLWVLSRTPQVDPALYQALLTRLTEKGFDVQRLQLTPQVY